MTCHLTLTFGDGGVVPTSCPGFIYGMIMLFFQIDTPSATLPPIIMEVENGVLEDVFSLQMG